MDVTVCVGERCHLGGAEGVVRTLLRILDEEGLRERVRLRGSFCMGECPEGGGATVRFGDRVRRVLATDAEAFVRECILPPLC